MNKRKINGQDTVIVFDRIVKTSELSTLIKDFCGDVIITKKLVIDKQIDISCNLYVIGGIVRKHALSNHDININGDLYCYGEIHCHNINVRGTFYSEKSIYSKTIRVGENLLCDDKIDAYGSMVLVAGDLECNAITAGRIEYLGNIKIDGPISVIVGMKNGCSS